MGALEVWMGQISIWGRMKNNPPEKIDSASSEKEAARLAYEYKMAFGLDWTVWAGRRDQEPGRQADR